MASAVTLRWKRVVLKVPGEALAHPASGDGVYDAAVERLAGELSSARSELNVDFAVVVGGENVWRGATGERQTMDSATWDYMGMLATVINALCLQDALERRGQPARVL